MRRKRSLFYAPLAVVDNAIGFRFSQSVTLVSGVFGLSLSIVSFFIGFTAFVITLTAIRSSITVIIRTLFFFQTCDELLTITIVRFRFWFISKKISTLIRSSEIPKMFWHFNFVNMVIRLRSHRLSRVLWVWFFYFPVFFQCFI